MSRYLSGKRPYCKKIVPIVLLMLLLSGLGLSANAMWSPEILLWEDQPGGRELATLSASIIIDSLEHVHILYVHMFDPPAWDPQIGPHDQVNYVQFDNHGTLLVPEVMLSDSVEEANTPHLQFFGADSLCVMWFAAQEYAPAWSGLEYRILDLTGDCWVQNTTYSTPLHGWKVLGSSLSEFAEATKRSSSPGPISSRAFE